MRAGISAENAELPAGSGKERNMRKIDETAYIAEGAKIIKDVVLEKNSSVWVNAVLRGDEEQIIIGEGSNVQDNCVIHVGPECPTVLGKGVTVGHLTLLHGCRIGDNTLVGMNSTIMNGAVIGKNCVIGAGSLITKGTVIPDNSLAFGRPAKIVRNVTDKEIESNRYDADFYIKEAAEYREADR